LFQIQGESLVAPAVAARLSTSSYLQAAQSGPKYRGPWGTIATVSREEGVRALYNGLTPGLQRQMCFASVRIGLYDTVKQGYSDMLKGAKQYLVCISRCIHYGGISRPIITIKMFKI